MDRDISTSSAASTPGYIGAKRLPPWEVSDIPRVPHISSSAPPLSRAEMEALSSLWATRTPPDHSSNSQSDERFQDTAFAAPSPPSRTDTGSWSERKPSLTDSARGISPQPSQHRHMSPANDHIDAYASPNGRPQVVALPGTMSSRSNLGQPHTINSKKSSSKRQHKKGSKGSKDLSELENDTGLKTEQKLNEFLTDRTHTDELYSTPLEAAADILSSSWQRRISKVKIPEFGTAISMPIKRRQTLIQDQKLTDYHWWLTT
ncbi:hypothetical protein D6D23_00122 [Aureobasidium pullulans]|uniref:Uncharacterized protein n=1 Tax=Aureobasidium pullulans TaxID=5580 RepID=A0A4S8UQN8_AURPU|nr:hypothetical protein D6D26_05904 [Aureobasidium pullulans]THW30640.1 hypothetical protein D6D23_00122 [Aureobasidium pullulans]THW44780.1 hypothetical protein D6D22_03852 [Aureobasidium pullulans]THZ30520.1 hypothetical protein D6C89_01479 [Aureobasidium pullulans]